MRVALLCALAALCGCASRGSTLSKALGSEGAPGRVELVDVPLFAQDDYQCGPAALATALTYSGVALSPSDLTPQVYLPGKEGSLQIEMAAAVRRHGRIGYLTRPALSAIAAEVRSGRPVVVFQNLGVANLPIWHFAVVVGYSEADDSVVLHAGRNRSTVMSGFNFVRTWQLGGSWALVVLRPDELPASNDPAGYLKAVAAGERVGGPDIFVAAYSAALRRWPDNSVAQFGLANALRSSGQVDAAITEYRRLIRRHPADAAALNNFADALNLRGCRVEALATIDRALAAKPRPELLSVLHQTRQEILGGKGKITSETPVCSD